MPTNDTDRQYADITDQLRACIGEHAWQIRKVIRSITADVEATVAGHAEIRTMVWLAIRNYVDIRTNPSRKDMSFEQLMRCDPAKVPDYRKLNEADLERIANQIDEGKHDINPTLADRYRSHAANVARHSELSRIIRYYSWDNII